MGTRAEKKQLLRNKIIEAAKIVFQEQGYENTTIEQIAKQAEVGLGTAYNYFKSKEELYILSMAENVADCDMEANMNDINPEDISSYVADVIIKQLKKMNYVNKKVWKTAIPFIFNGLKQDSFFLKDIVKADFQFMDRIRDLLNDLISKKLLPKDFEVDLVVDLIFSNVFYQVMLYMYQDDMTFEAAVENIRRGIRYLF
jgi:AcrR family transcriptional regulator